MTPPWMPETVGFCVRWIGNAVKGSATAVRAVTIASLSLAEILLRLIGDHVADDVSQVKDSFIRRQVAEADSAEAESKKKLAEAVEAANRANLHKRKDRLAFLELEAKRLQNAKTQAETQAILADADTRRAQAIAEGKARLIEALSKLKQEGGAAFFDKESLQRILDTPHDIYLQKIDGYFDASTAPLDSA